jgi:hypothetical protein
LAGGGFIPLAIFANTSFNVALFPGTWLAGQDNHFHKSLFQNANYIRVSFGTGSWRKLLILYEFGMCGLSNVLQG